MGSSDIGDGHPRPTVEEDEPPAKQLKLSFDDDELAIDPQTQTIAIKSVQVDETNHALPLARGNVIVDLTAPPISKTTQVTLETIGNVGTEKLSTSNVSSMVVDSVTVNVTAESRSARVIVGTTENVGTESVEAEAAAEAHDSLSNDYQIVGSVPNGKQENGLSTGGETAVEKPGNWLAADLGAGTSAVQRTKTSLCSYFRKKGCKHGADCRYAHGEEELKQRPDGSWDPTSERGKSLLQKEPVSSVARVATVPAKAHVGEEADKSGVNSLSKCIVHVPRSWSVDQFKKFLSECNISYTTVKKRKGMTVAFVGFKTPEDVVKATEILDGKTVNKKTLKVADSRSRTWEKDGGINVAKEDSTAQDDGAEGTRDLATVSDDGGVGDLEMAALISEGAVGPVRNVCDAVTPLANKPYEEQLNVKRDSITQVLKRLVRNTRKGIPSGDLLPNWITAAKDMGGLPCALEGVLASPMIDGYRNKCEFSIGCSAEGERVVGFQMGSFRDGVLAVAEPTDCRNVSAIAQSYAAAFQRFVRKSELPVWNKQNNSGFWRLLIVREGRAARLGEVSWNNISSVSEVMLVVQVCSTGVSEEKRSAEYTKMTDALLSEATSASPCLPLTALVVQDHEGISNVASPDAPLHPLVLPKSEHIAQLASEYIHDHIGKLQFRISPTAFFQVNTPAAERLYSLAGDWAGLTPDTLLFDVCCGTGTIGLTLAHRVGLVVGIEMNASAVADANKNAEMNGITNCRFVCSKAEDVMESLLKEYLALEESDPTVNEGETMKSERNGQSAQLPEICQTLNAQEGDAVLVGIREVDIAGVETMTAISEVEQVSCSGSDLGSQTARAQCEGHGAQERQPRQKYKNIVAIVDPPRVGLHHVVLKTLRLHTELRRLVYISCNPESLLANAVELCTPLNSDPNAEKGKGAWRGRVNWKGMSNVGQARQRVKKMPPSEAFKPVKAIAVDLFPHTVHCEMVMLLER